MEAKNTIFTTFGFSDYICWYSGINTYEQANTQAAKARNSENTDFMGQVINLLFNEETPPPPLVSIVKQLKNTVYF